VHAYCVYGVKSEISQVRNLAPESTPAGFCVFLSDTVSSEISDFTPCTHAQSNILHVKYAEKIDY